MHACIYIYISIYLSMRCRVKMLAKFWPCFFSKISFSLQSQAQVELKCWCQYFWRWPAFWLYGASILTLFLGLKLHLLGVPKNAEAPIFVVFFEKYRTHTKKRSRQITRKNCKSRVLKNLKVEAKLRPPQVVKGKKNYKKRKMKTDVGINK